MKDALYYGKQLCDTMMRKFDAKDLPPVSKFHYHQGVFLSGMEKIYYLCHEEKYAEYIKAWVDSIIYPDGSIHNYDRSMLDDIQPGILLFRLHETTGDSRYLKAIKEYIGILEEWPVNSEGGFWHKALHPDQMWLDGLYMAGPFEAEFGAKFDQPKWFDVVTEQALLMKKHTRDEKTGLYYHAWDCEKIRAWADPETGRSPEFWGRAVGWYAVAAIDILDFLPQWHEKRDEMIETVHDLLMSLAKFQDEKCGLWYQVLDKGDHPDNWVEISCSCLFVAAMFKAMRKGYISHELYETAQKGYEGVIATLKLDEDGNTLLNGVCIGTDVSDYQTYIERPTSTNDLHGAGAFLLMCAEQQMYQNGANLNL